MKLSTEDLKYMAQVINSEQNDRKEEHDKYMLYHGSVKAVVKRAIVSEFKRKETIHELMNRLVSLNIMKKVVDKLAGVYKEAPIRSVVSEDKDEQAFLESLEDSFDMNMIMKEANRDFKRSKRALIEIFKDDNNKPSLRVIPPHSYRPFAIRKKKLSEPNAIVKIEEKRLIVWSDESYFITDRKGVVLKDAMAKLENEDATNDYGVLPFVYINDSSSLTVPIQDDDLLGISIVIPLLLTDLLFGLKYQCWSVLWTVGVKGDIDFNPNSIVHLDFGEEGEEPSINQLKPDIDSDKMLSVILSIMSLLLTTKNLKVENLDSNLSVQNAASGLSKMLDNAESVEDKKDQQAFFLKAEREIFDKYRIIHNTWKSAGTIHKDFDQDLSDDFEVDTTLREPTPIISEEQKVKTSKSKIDARLSSIRRELKNVHPNLDDGKIEDLYKEIMDEVRSMNSTPRLESDNGMES